MVTCKHEEHSGIFFGGTLIIVFVCGNVGVTYNSYLVVITCNPQLPVLCTGYHKSLQAEHFEVCLDIIIIEFGLSSSACYYYCY